MTSRFVQKLKEKTMNNDESEFFPLVYVACAKSYAKGEDWGTWVDPVQSLEEVQAQIQDLLDCSSVKNADDYFIKEYRGFYGLPLGETPDLEELVEIADKIWIYGASWAAYLLDNGESSTEEDYLDRYLGESPIEDKKRYEAYKKYKCINIENKLYIFIKKLPTCGSSVLSMLIQL